MLLAAALLIGLIVGGIFFALSGFDPFSAYRAILVGAFGSVPAIFLTLSQATPLMFTGLAYALAFKCGLINIGTEGQLYFGGFCAVVAGIYLPLPWPLLLPVCLIAAMLGGGLWALLAGYLKVKFKANEVISTIMLNSIIIGIVGYLLSTFMLEKESWSSHSQAIQEAAQMPRFSAQYQVGAAVIIAVLLCFAVDWMLKRTTFGFDIRATGLNRSASETAGISPGKTIMLTMLISGAIAGLGGAGQTLGVDYRFVEGFSNNYGFDGVAVAALAYSNPLGVILTSILFGALKAGAMTLNRVAKVPMDFVTVIQAVIVLAVAAPVLIRKMLTFKLPKKGGKRNG